MSKISPKQKLLLSLGLTVIILISTYYLALSEVGGAAVHNYCVFLHWPFFYAGFYGGQGEMLVTILLWYAALLAIFTNLFLLMWKVFLSKD